MYGGVCRRPLTLGEAVTRILDWNKSQWTVLGCQLPEQHRPIRKPQILFRSNNIPLENPEDWLKLKHRDRTKDLWSLKKTKTVVFCDQLRTATNGCGAHFDGGESY